ncbi:MAG: UDP-glucose 4-epimerase GalE [Oligoflexales bacterium]
MTLKNKPILIIGGCGYIGSHIVKQLSERGFSPIVFDNLSSGHPDQRVHNEPLIIGDIGDSQLVQETLQKWSITDVIHLAGSIVVPDSIKEPASYYENNVSKTQKFFTTCSKNSVKNVIFSSSAAVYGPSSEILDEQHKTCPIHPYGRSKLMGEWILQDIAKAKDMNSIALRYFNVAGASLDGKIGQRGAKSTHLIKVAAEVVAGKRPYLTIYGTDYPTLDGTCIRDYIHVEDLASAHISALEHLQKTTHTSLTMNCGYGHGLSVREVTNAIQKIYPEFANKIKLGAQRVGDVPQLIASPKKIQQTLDWRPQHNNLNLMIRSACEWESKLQTLNMENE